MTSRKLCSMSLSRRRKESTVSESTASCPAWRDPTPSPKSSLQNSKDTGSGGELLEGKNTF